MLNIQEWGEGKSVGIVLIANEVVSTAQDFHLAFSHINQRRLYDYQFPFPNLSSWCGLYRNHRAGDAFIRDLVRLNLPYGDDALSVGDGLVQLSNEVKQFGAEHIKAEFAKMTKIEFKELTDDAQELATRLLKGSFAELENEVNGVPFTDLQEKVFLQTFSENELVASFYFLVVAPCWMLYQQHPTKLYRKAVRSMSDGNYDALEALLRLDSLMLHDPLIGKQLQQIRLKKKRNLYERLLEATLKKPKNKVTRKKMKYVMAGFLSSFSHHFNKPLTAPQIAALFDAAAKDYRGQLSDTDIPDNLDTFKTVLQRERPFWDRILIGTK